MKKVKELFLKYVQIHTQSDYNSKTYPSTQRQLDFARALAADCNTFGLSDVQVFDAGYVTATLPSNVNEETPVVSFIAHMDTSPDCSGENVKPQIIESYDGGDIILKNKVTLSPNEFPALNNYIGQEIITGDGTTLLGADDKAGISEILAAMSYLAENPEIKHGKIRVAFTPDEEVGRGVDNFNVEQFGADFGFTIDGGRVGELEFESFNAARASFQFIGKSVHPGTAKNTMVNASLLLMELASQFPSAESPANTDGYEGFYHISNIWGSVEAAKFDCIIRDFDKANFLNRKKFVTDIVGEMNMRYGREVVILNLHDEYYNMREVLEDKKYIIDLAAKSMEEAGVTPIMNPIRGGTDGCRLSFMGLPCPNIFTGGHNFHGPYEFVPTKSMEKAAEVIVNICKNTAAMKQS